ncbi:hypothetical protein QFZ82_007805 [Streptomyces sp. V4I23]|nr:hypothetical protein [Streptomyces sp. V4I23]
MMGSPRSRRLSMPSRKVPYGLMFDQNSAVSPRRSSSVSFFAQAGSEDLLQQQGVDVHEAGLEQVQGEHRGLVVHLGRSGRRRPCRSAARCSPSSSSPPPAARRGSPGGGRGWPGSRWRRWCGPRGRVLPGLVSEVLGSATGEAPQHLLGLRRAQPQRGGVLDHLVRVLPALDGLGVALQAEALLAQHVGEGVGGYPLALAGEIGGQVARGLRRPPQRRHRITPHIRFDHSQQRRTQSRVQIDRPLAAPAGPAHRPNGASLESSSSAPSETVASRMPAARATSLIPPWPIDRPPPPAAWRRMAAIAPVIATPTVPARWS